MTAELLVLDPERDDPAAAALGRVVARAGAVMRGGMGLVACAAALLGVGAPASLRWVVAAVTAEVVWTAVFTVVGLRRGLLTWAVMVEVGLTSLLGLAQGNLVAASALPGGASWIAGLVTLSVIIAGFAWHPVAAVPAGLLMTGFCLAGVRLSGGADSGLVTAGIHVVQVAAVAVLITLLRRAGRLADRMLAEVRETQRVAALVQAERTLEREADRRLHDTVLQTLTTVGSGAIAGSSRAVRERAAHDLAVLDGLIDVSASPDRPVALDQRLREVSARPDLDVVAELAPCVTTAAVAAAFTGAVNEALTNVVRHAGVGTATLSLVPVGAGGMRVEVADEGDGFDTARVAAHRFGMREAIIGRMRSVGGDAEVLSTSEGSRVRMWWGA